MISEFFSGNDLCGGNFDGGSASRLLFLSERFRSDIKDPRRDKRIYCCITVFENSVFWEIESRMTFRTTVQV
jgi:hypothetical protein